MRQINFNLQTCFVGRSNYFIKIEDTRVRKVIRTKKGISYGYSGNYLISIKQKGWQFLFDHFCPVITTIGISDFQCLNWNSCLRELVGE